MEILLVLSVIVTISVGSWASSTGSPGGWLLAIFAGIVSFVGLGSVALRLGDRKPTRGESYPTPQTVDTDWSAGSFDFESPQSNAS
jgi:hypothetical protein